MPIQAEAKHDENSHDAERDSNDHAQAAGSLLSLGGGGQSPLAEEIPNSHAEMKGGGENPDHEERQVPRVL